MFHANSYSRHHYACYSTATLCFNLLMEYGADFNIQSDKGYAPIFNLIHKIYRLMMEFLVILIF